MLAEILKALPSTRSDDVLVGTEDDAGVYRISDDTALVQTVDFFTPVVDDPEAFGAIAAANALSDVYAMGARPLTALNLVAFPKDGPLDVLAAIMRGGANVATEAGVAIIGGHSIDDREPKYGMAVTGIVHPGKMILKAGAKPGDVLVLTKPLGTGIVTTAIKADRAPQETITAAVATMRTLNKAASEAMIEAGVKGATDITGFGLLGHLREMLLGSRVGAILRISQVPLLAGVKDLIRLYVPAGTRANLRFAADSVTWCEGVTEEDKLLLADAQTSGGLLIAVAKDRLDSLLAGLASRGVATRAVIGETVEGEPGRISVQ